jgi:TIR domain/NB-ARC domain
MSEGSIPVEVFCSYAHEDEVWLHKLEKHLSLLKRQGLISLWHDRLITPGIDWARTIDTHLETASVILLLVSADFFASDYCYGIEVKRALERQEANEAQVIPILVRPVDWKGAPFAHLRVLPTDAKPLVSWQSKDAALTDIAAGIRRVIEDLPLLAASTPRAIFPAIWNIPFPRNPFFSARDELLTRLHRQFQMGQTIALSQPQALSGLGGIGKTQIAIEYAYRFYQDYQAILWVYAGTTEALLSSYEKLAILLRLPEREAKEQEIIVQAVKTWLQTHRGWLLILDHVEEPVLLRNFLPPVLTGHVLMTTRAGTLGPLAQRVDVETFSEEQSALLLLRRAGFLSPDSTLEQASSQERILALQIAKNLGELPLALDQAAAYMEETACSLQDYLNFYQSHQNALLARRGELVADYPASVATTWALAFQKVEEKNPAAAELLRFCAYLAPNEIAEEIIIQGASYLGTLLKPIATDAFLLGQSVEILRAYSLVRRNPATKTLSIHRLVQAVLRETLPIEASKEWATRVIYTVNAVFPSVDFRTWQLCQRYLPHAQISREYIENTNLPPSRKVSGSSLTLPESIKSKGATIRFGGY